MQQNVKVAGCNLLENGSDFIRVKRIATTAFHCGHFHVGVRVGLTCSWMEMKRSFTSSFLQPSQSVGATLSLSPSLSLSLPLPLSRFLLHPAQLF